MSPDQRRPKTWLITTAAALGIALGAAGIAGAITGGSSSGASSTSGSSTSGASAATAAPNPATAPNGPGETLLTGTTAEKVKAAALAAVPGGTIIRIETDSDGSPYEAHVTKSDGSQVTVKVDASFAVTSTESGFGGPGGGAPHALPNSAPAASTGA